MAKKSTAKQTKKSFTKRTSIGGNPTLRNKNKRRLSKRKYRGQGRP